MSTFFTNTNGTLTYQAELIGHQHQLRNNSTVADKDHLLKQAIWGYFLLLIFEGALRKWLLPGLATPLLVVRDPIALWLVAKAWQRGLFPVNIYLTGTVLIGVISIFTATLIGHGNIFVALFGARILLIHFPLMFVIGRILNREDVLKMGKVLLWISIPMAVLIAMQFYSPQSAWVNRGVAGVEGGAAFSGALGYSRPPGTFSFTNGLTSFFGFVASFLLYFWLNSKNVNRLLLIGATVALIAAIPLSISRGLFFQVGVAIAFAFMVVSRKPEYLGKLIIAGIGIFITLTFLSSSEFFATATEAFSHRFDTANRIEGGVEGVLLDRYLGGMVGALTGNDKVPFFGYGTGMGTNVGSMLLTGRTKFLISEGEWGRLIGELGVLMGIAMIFIRLGFCMKVTVAAYKRLAKGDFLPWMLLSFGLLVVPQSQWAQPTTLGFSTLIGGMILASFRIPKQDKAKLRRVNQNALSN